MKKVIHIASGLFAALSFLLSFFLMAGIDGDYTVTFTRLLICAFIHTFAWCIVYYVTGENTIDF